jgi:succinate dehydrogenase / fumarate reductase membrane anchor subunit
MRVVIEDYIHKPATKTLLLMLNLFVCWLGAAIGIFSILKVAFGGGAY